MELSPNNIRAHLLAGVFAAQTGNYEIAIEHLEKAKNLGSTSAFLPLALSYVQVEGNTKKARTIMEEYQEKCPQEEKRVEEFLIQFQKIYDSSRDFKRSTD